MADCGKDLERASVPGYDQARSLLAQVGEKASRVPTDCLASSTS
jgi:hypothetical protein